MWHFIVNGISKWATSQNTFSLVQNLQIFILEQNITQLVFVNNNVAVHNSAFFTIYLRRNDLNLRGGSGGGVGWGLTRDLLGYVVVYREKEIDWKQKNITHFVKDHHLPERSVN